jgi:hypothetical protein
VGQFLPRHLTERAAALPHKTAAPTVRHRGSYGSWLCENAQTRNGGRMNILRIGILVRKDSPANSASLVWRKITLVAFQFFAFLHSLGQ